MKAPRIMIAATGSGTGKTTITCALLETLKQRNLAPRAFKCGPDYIDPMFHRQVIGVPSRNLDSFFSGEEQIRSLFRMENEGQISVVEGVMGLYDGLGGIRREGSAYHLAEILDMPVILVIDAHGMGRSVVPMLAGFLQYDERHLIKAVILNRTSPMFCKTITPVIERELSIPVLGCFPNCQELQLKSRHLGLKLPQEIADLKEQVKQAAEMLAQYVDVNRLCEIADQAPEMEEEMAQSLQKYLPENHKMWVAEKGTKLHGREMQSDEEGRKLHDKNMQPAWKNTQSDCPKIAVARDEAFCFYYEDNLRLLRQAGAELVYFSPIHDTVLPKDVDGILLGGGYPELVADRLAKNRSMRESVKDAILRGVPSVAECGGFMYLHEKMITADGREHAMCGVLPAVCTYQDKLVRFGYIEIAYGENQVIKAHEFHYFDSTDNGADCQAQKPVTGKTYSCIHRGNHYWWGFPHLYYPSNPEFAKHFVDCVRQWRYSKKSFVNAYLDKEKKG